MANSIQLPSNFVDLLDEVYVSASLTADLNSGEEMFRKGNNTKEISYMQVVVSGLGDYTREDGTSAGSYSNNNTVLEWKTTQFNYDRGTKIAVDAMDDAESFGKLFAAAGAELIRTKVIPESDAFTFATLASEAGTVEYGTLANGEAFLSALITATSEMDELEVPQEGRILYTTPTLYNSIMALDTTKSREVLSSFEKIVKVPQSRFYTAIDLLDGKSSGEEAGFYRKSDNGTDINFMILHRGCVIKFDKHVVGDIIEPKLNADSDAYILKYRKYGIVDVYNNKKNGIYLHAKENAPTVPDDPQDP